MEPPSLRTRLLTVLWILGILFPMGFLAAVWKPFGRLFDRAFASGWSHVVMHATLYLVLAFLLAQLLRPALLVLCLALLTGVAQEALQWLSIQAEVGWAASAFDLLVDLSGALLGLGLARLWLVRRQPRV